MHFVAMEPRKVLVQKAGPRRKVTRTYTRLSELSKQMSRGVQLNLVKGIKTFKKRISSDALFEAWKTGSYGHLMKTIPFDKLPEDLESYRNGIGTTAVRAGNYVIENLPAPVKLDLRYDLKNPSIQRYLDNRTGSLVHDISMDTQRVIQQAVASSWEMAVTPDKVASQIKGSIGLLPRHATAVDNYRDELTAQGASPLRIEELVGKYQDRLLDYRANMIARTETRFATNQGQLDIWKAAANQDLIDRHTAKKVWYTDGNPCEICDPMDGVAVPLDGFWTLNTGDVVEIPTESHPHCFCGMELDFGNAEERLDEGSPDQDEETEE
jgi:hypothetical protein